MTPERKTELRVLLAQGVIMCPELRECLDALDECSAPPQLVAPKPVDDAPMCPICGMNSETERLGDGIARALAWLLQHHSLACSNQKCRAVPTGGQPYVQVRAAIECHSMWLQRPERRLFPGDWLRLGELLSELERLLHVPDSRDSYP